MLLRSLNISHHQKLLQTFKQGVLKHYRTPSPYSFNWQTFSSNFISTRRPQDIDILNVLDFQIFCSRGSRFFLSQMLGNQVRIPRPKTRMSAMTTMYKYLKCFSAWCRIFPCILNKKLFFKFFIDFQRIFNGNEVPYSHDVLEYDLYR